MKIKPLHALAAAGLAIALTLSASPAMAQGNFNIKIVPWGCTEGDFAGASMRKSGQAYAYTYNTLRSCVPTLQFDMRTTVSAGGVTSQSVGYWGDSFYHQIEVYLNRAGTPSGWHYYRSANSNNQIWQRYT